MLEYRQRNGYRDRRSAYSFTEEVTANLGRGAVTFYFGFLWYIQEQNKPVQRTGALQCRSTMPYLPPPLEREKANRLPYLDSHNVMVSYTCQTYNRFFFDSRQRPLHHATHGPPLCKQEGLINQLMAHSASREDTRYANTQRLPLRGAVSDFLRSLDGTH